MTDELEKNMQHIKDLKAQARDIQETIEEIERHPWTFTEFAPGESPKNRIKVLQKQYNETYYLIQSNEEHLSACNDANSPQWQEECAEAARMKYPPLEVYLKECQ